MIGYNKLGSNGRIGNQMFQYASLRGIADNLNYDWCIPPEDYNHDSNYGLFETFDLKNLSPKNIGFIDGQSAQENNHNFNSDLFTQCLDNTSLDGYFQTEKYFAHIENQIREDFVFNKNYLNPCKEYIDSLDDTPIFLHVRRTDAVGREQYHPILPISYFKDALKNFSESIPCFVFSDDITWCKEQDYFKQDRFLFNESNHRYSYRTADGTGEFQNTLLPQIDLCLMSLCSGAIIANSSFSWWGAWLQNNKGKVIAPDPKKWFGSAMTHLDTSDIVPKNWIIQKWEK